MEVLVVIEGADSEEHRSVANRIKVHYPPGAYCAITDEIGEPDASSAGWVGFTVSVDQKEVLVNEVNQAWSA
jgi:hypothetical protein